MARYQKDVHRAGLQWSQTEYIEANLKQDEEVAHQEDSKAISPSHARVTHRRVTGLFVGFVSSKVTGGRGCKGYIVVNVVCTR